MLILTRRIGESIYIESDSINVRILGINGNQVRVGIQAPPVVGVWREEIYDKWKNGRPVETKEEESEYNV